MVVELLANGRIGRQLASFARYWLAQWLHTGCPVELGGRNITRMGLSARALPPQLRPQEESRRGQQWRGMHTEKKESWVLRHW